MATGIILMGHLVPDSLVYSAARQDLAGISTLLAGQRCDNIQWLSLCDPIRQEEASFELLHFA
jgi:hypothetical protein